MGMDVYGESGNYFRNNVWWWRPLADYCLRAAPHLCAPCDEWHSNSGDGLDAANSTALATTLQAHIDCGACLVYQEEYLRNLSEMPDEVCGHCNGTGTRNDENFQGKCNGCEGKGKRRPFDTWYPFSVENVQEFTNFLRESGGFKIC